MTLYTGSFLIAVIGISSLTGLTFGATKQSRQIAAVVQPWQSDGLTRAAATGLSIIDLHWNNHIIILDTGDDPAALTRLRDQGFWLLDATGTALCDSILEGA